MTTSQRKADACLAACSKPSAARLVAQRQATRPSVAAAVSSLPVQPAQQHRSGGCSPFATRASVACWDAPAGRAAPDSMTAMHPDLHCNLLSESDRMQMTSFCSSIGPALVWWASLSRSYRGGRQRFSPPSASQAAPADSPVLPWQLPCSTCRTGDHRWSACTSTRTVAVSAVSFSELASLLLACPGVCMGAGGVWGAAASPGEVFAGLLAPARALSGVARPGFTGDTDRGASAVVL